MAQPLLEGQSYVTDDAREVIQLQAKIAHLEQVKRQLEEALRLERNRTQTIEASAKDLKDILYPLFRSLKLVFGEFHDMGLPEVGEANVPQFDPKWKAWQDKFGTSTAPAKVIQAILDHGPLNRSQLRQAAEIGWSTLDAATTRLKNLSLIEKANDRWNLKG